jgi:MFS family permease
VAESIVPVASAAPTSAPGSGPAFPAEGRGWYVVFVLCLCNIVAFTDRQIINLLVDDIKADLLVTDTQISLLQGLAFALFYALLALPLGRLADGGNRRLLITAAILIWTGATVACGLADSFTELFLARMLVGIGEAVLTPAGYSILADLFRSRRLSLPVSMFTGSTFFGSGIALLAGGFVISSLSAMESPSLPLFGPLELWQAAFIVAAMPGFAVALLFLLTVREPVRQGEQRHGLAPDPTAASFGRALRHWRDHARLFTLVYVGLSLLAAAQFATGAWAPAFFIRIHGWQAAEIGYLYGTLFLVFGSSGVVAGGWLANQLHARGLPDANVRTALIGGLGALPMGLLFPLVSDPRLALALIALLMLFGTMPFGAGTAVIPILAPARLRAQFVAAYLLFANLIGQAGGPWLVATVTDRAFGAPDRVGSSLSIVVSLLLAGGVLTCWAALRPLRSYLAATRSG